MANKKTHQYLDHTNPFSNLSNVADEYRQLVKEQLVIEGIYSDPDCVPTSLIDFIIESWARVYEAGYADGHPTIRH